jgi:hypothetical protein
MLIGGFGEEILPEVVEYAVGHFQGINFLNDPFLHF